MNHFFIPICATQIVLAGFTHADEWKPGVKTESVPTANFHLPKDSNLEVTLWASSPMLYNPTNMDVDSKGRIWVAEAVNYRKVNPRPDGDRIVVLQDTDLDGKADTSHTFVQEKGLQAPLGVSVFDNKIVVPMPPNLLIYTDVDRDLKFDPKVDKKEIFLTGFNAGQHDHSLHSVTGGPDGKWYFNNGNCGAVFTDKSGKTFKMNGAYRGGGGKYFVKSVGLNGAKSDDGFVWTSGFGVRVNTDGTNAEIYGHGFRNSYENSINSLGDIYQSDNDDYQSCRNSYILEYGSAGFFSRDGRNTWKVEARPGQTIPRAHWRQDDPGTFDVGDIYGGGSPTGNVFYENGALGDDWIGSYFSCEAGRNTIFGYQPEAKGAAFLMERSDFLTTNLSGEMVGADSSRKLKSMDGVDKSILFRPSDVAVGVDGAIYVSDWYDGRVGGHSTLDKSSGGAIYRVAPKGFKSSIPELDLTTIGGQILALQSPAINVRFVGFSMLKDQGEKAFDAVVANMEHANKYVAARSIWLLPYLGEKGVEKVNELLTSSDAETRIVAYRALRRAGMHDIAHAKLLASDPNAAIRRDVALSLRHYSAEDSMDVFITLAKAYDGEDKNYLEAIGLGAEEKENAIWEGLKTGLNQTDAMKWDAPFAKLTWRLWPSRAISDLKKRAESSSLSVKYREFAIESLAFIDSADAVDACVDIFASSPLVKNKAQEWLVKRTQSNWQKFDLKNKLKKAGIYDPDKMEVTSITVEEPPAKSKLSVASALKLEGDAARGKQSIMRCVMCHNIDGVGPNYGPFLKGWGSTQSREAIITSIIEPSADIAHGFKGNEIQLKDGGTVHGVVLGLDPLLVTSTGGITQTIPKSKIKKSISMKRSLMLSAEQLGLSEQDVADIATYMQQWK